MTTIAARLGKTVSGFQRQFQCDIWSHCGCSYCEIRKALLSFWGSGLRAANRLCERRDLLLARGISRQKEIGVGPRWAPAADASSGITH